VAECGAVVCANCERVECVRDRSIPRKITREHVSSTRKITAETRRGRETGMDKEFLLARPNFSGGAVAKRNKIILVVHPADI